MRVVYIKPNIAVSRGEDYQLVKLKTSFRSLDGSRITEIGINTIAEWIVRNYLSTKSSKSFNAAFFDFNCKTRALIIQTSRTGKKSWLNKLLIQYHHILYEFMNFNI